MSIHGPVAAENANFRHHYDCFWSKNRKYPSEENFAGFADLSAEDQDKLRAHFNEGKPGFRTENWPLFHANLESMQLRVSLPHWLRLTLSVSPMAYASFRQILANNYTQA